LLPWPKQLSEAELRKVIGRALYQGELIYGSTLMEKLASHGVTMVDLLHVCGHWELIRSVRWAGGAWRYRIEGPNSDGKWMAVVLSVKDPDAEVVAITGFRFARGKTKR
jgi:hypothetical protein